MITKLVACSVLCLGILTSLLFPGLSFAAAQQKGVLVAPSDTPDQVVAKAVQVRPHDRQIAWQEKEFTAFIHFGMNTFTNAEWGSGKEKPAQFMPTQFDARQWVRAFKSAGMRGVVLTAKHHDGFCLWQTNTTEHSIKNSPWRDGKGDVVRDVSDACHAEGLAFGVYLSPWDRNTKEFGKPGYNKIFQQQLRELLTRYGDVYDVWFDGAHAPKDKPEIFDWSGHYRLIRELQPGACISVMGPDVRWCGNEGGHTRSAEWNVVGLDSSDPRPAELSQETTEALVKRFKSQAADLGSRDVIRNSRQLIWRPAMTNTSIRPGWFYHSDQDSKLRSLENLLDIYYGSVGGNTQFLLNIPPDRRGLVHEHDVLRLAEMGKILRATFDENFLATATCPHDSDSAAAPSKSIDGDARTFATNDASGSSLEIEYRLDGTKTFNVAMLQEALKHGQRIERFSIDAWQDGQWKAIASATTVGYKRLLRFDAVTTDRLRLRVEQSRANPMISEFGIFFAPPILTAPKIARDRQGQVTISAQPGIEVRYTLDGSAPNRKSSLFHSPFPLPLGGQVRAIALPGGAALDLGASTMAQREFGRAKTKWRVVSVNSEEPTANNHAAKAIDDDPETFWHTQWRGANPDYPHEIVIDLGERIAMSGFTYLPRQDGADGGLVAKYLFYVSDAPDRWGDPVVAGDFANVLNNPIEQRVVFAKIHSGRYVRFVALESPNDKPWAGAAELGLLEVPHNSTDPKSEAPPNIVLIMADDLGWMDLHCQGNTQLDTPNIDRLAAQGKRFTDAYAAAPVCTPTRAAMMTGQAPARLAITNHAPGNPDHVSKDSNLRGAEWTTYLSLNHVTIAERLKQAGYATGFVGKWHLSHRPGKDNQGPLEPRLRPEHQGYDMNVGGCRMGGPPSYFEPYKIPNITPRRQGDYLPDRLADECIAFLDKNREQPFFLTWWNYSVHYPIQAPEHLLKKYRERGGLEEPDYAAMIEGMDGAIGRVLTALDSMGLSENTLLIFTSDNGSLFGNAPLRKNKGYLYEGGIRVPWIVRWPGIVEPGSTCSVPIISNDTYPTLLEVAGLPPEAEHIVDGASLVPLLRDTGTFQQRALYFHYPNYAFHKNNRLGSAIRDGDYKLIKFYDDQSLELYNLATDLSEQRNLADKMPDRARAMNKQLDAWLTETHAKMPVHVPNSTTQR